MNLALISVAALAIAVLISCQLRNVIDQTVEQ